MKSRPSCYINATNPGAAAATGGPAAPTKMLLSETLCIATACAQFQEAFAAEGVVGFLGLQGLRLRGRPLRAWPPPISSSATTAPATTAAT